MKRILILLSLSLFSGPIVSGFQGGGGEPKKPTKKKAVAKKNAGVTKSANAKPNQTATAPSSRQKPAQKPKGSTERDAAEINVRSTPANSMIFIDGESIGVTNEAGWLKLPSFKPGVYTVSVSKTGYRPDMKVIRLLAGRKEMLDFKLVAGTQILNISSSAPQTDVYVDGVLRGITDGSGNATLTGITIGERQVTLRKTRYQDASFPLSVSADKPGHINAKLELAVGFLTVITVNSPNSRIDIAGIGQFENAVNKIECPPGRYVLTISSPSYVTSTREVTVAAGQEAKLSVDLVADTAARAASEVNTGSSKAVTEITPTVTTPPGNYVVPNGLGITGMLENEINTKNSKNYDGFRLTVQSPNEFRGATIEGYISGIGRAGKVKGKSTITFNFQKITLRQGQTYDFAASLQNILDHTGRTVQVDNEGTAKGNSKTKKTAKRGGIGAAIGAIAGGIVGGAAGAAIGAAAGGAAGAASAAIENEDIKLKKGSTIWLQSSSPVRRN